MKPRKQSILASLLFTVLYAAPLDAAMQGYFADFVNPARLFDVNPGTAALTGCVRQVVQEGAVGV